MMGDPSYAINEELPAGLRERFETIYRRFGYLVSRIEALEGVHNDSDPIVIRAGECATVCNANGLTHLVGPVARSYFKAGDMVQFLGAAKS